jgi:hypothetical protein
LVGRVGPICVVSSRCGPGDGEREGDFGLVPHLLISFIIWEEMAYLEVLVLAIGDLGGGAA